MKPNESAEREVFRTWRVNAPLPRHFKSNVWRGISAERHRTTLWSAFSQWLRFTLYRPAPVLVCLSLALTIGGGTGYWMGHLRRAASSEALLSRYVQSVDPYQALLLAQP